MLAPMVQYVKRHAKHGVFYYGDKQMIKARQPKKALHSMFAFTVAILLMLFNAPPSVANESSVNACSAKTIKMADQAWESASFITHVLRIIINKGYGCNVEVVPGTSAAIESALAQNDIQIIAEQWSGRSPIIEQGIQQGAIQVVGDTLSGGAEQGWYVPDYVVHGDPVRNIEPMAPNLHSWRDLPNYKHLFQDPEQPDKGRFLNCPTGWVCELTNTRLLQIHGLDANFNNFRAGTGAALDSAISSAYEQGRPILFYYWQPAGLMAKYKFYKIKQDPFNEECWHTIVSGEGRLCSSDFLLARLGVAVSTPFANNYPELVSFFKRLEFTPAIINSAILKMNEQRLPAEVLANEFLQNNAAMWKEWLPQDVAETLASNLGVEEGISTSSAVLNIFPEWSMAQSINNQLSAIVRLYGESFRGVSNFLLSNVLLPIENGLQATPAWLVLIITAALTLHSTRSLVSVLVYVAGLYLIGAVGLWDKLIQTFALVLVATLLSIIIGVPVGILGASWRGLRKLLTPVMDIMQTLPSFVYLIPVLMLFGLGKVPALFATIIYAVPPLIRLTILGLNQVDKTATEAAQSFGVTPWQMLTRVTLPLARPSIMAGINQATMMALAMVVVASMIGAQGLGEDVLAGIQTLDVGRGLQAGGAIVILAIVIDRITQAYGKSVRRRRSHKLNKPRQQEFLQEASAAIEPVVISKPATDQYQNIDLEVRNVYKVFGPNRQEATRLLVEGRNKSEVQLQTNSNVGLNNVNLQIPAGQITCIMGLSGSGKSTLVRHMNRLIDPTQGEILIDGQNILTLSLAELRRLRRSTISMVFQGFGLLPHINVIDNVAFGLRVRGEPRRQAHATALLWLEKTGLSEYAYNYPDELSGGMRQRVGLARALATNARILLMDEAFSALDPLIRYEMQDQLLALQERLQKTIVFITHDIDEALRLGQHIVILRDGAVEQVGTPDRIVNNPANEYVAQFVARHH